MKFYTKILCTALAVFMLTMLSLSATGCTHGSALENSIFELKKCVYLADGEYPLKATYGFNKAENTTTDANVYGLYFYITSPLDEVTRTVYFSLDGKDYSAKFSLNPVTNSTVAFIEIADFSESSFSVTILEGSTRTDVTLTSAIPKNTLTYTGALTALEKNQSALLDNYKTADGAFTASIIIRIIVKDGEPFWYIGLKDKKDNLKAFLLDGYSGETLAIREIF